MEEIKDINETTATDRSNEGGKASAEKRSKGSSIWVKTVAFIGMLLCSVVIPICALGAIYCYTEGYYVNSFRRVLKDALHEQALDDEQVFIMSYVNGHTRQAENDLKYGNVAYAEIREYDELNRCAGEICWSYGDSSVIDNSYYDYKDTIVFFGVRKYDCRLVLGYDLERDDAYRNVFLITRFVYSLRYLVYFIAFSASVGWIFLIVFLIRSAGYRKNSDKPQPCFESKIPFEISLGAVVFLAVIVAYITGVAADDGHPTVVSIATLLLGAVIEEIILVLSLICLAIRIKTGYIWRTMILRYIVNGIRWIFSHMSVLWQTLVFCLGTGFLFFMSKWFSNRYFVRRHYIAGWVIFFVAAIAAFVFVMYVAYSYNKMYKMTEDIANGKLPEEVNTKYMLPVFKKHAENILKISRGVVISNEKRFASEKTQAALITNVSHDIKTPLTSIINYADLIAKEESDNEKINEYAEVLERQSTRLKRLLEDLIEVSKAQSGSLEVNLEPCMVSNFLTQSAGEYEERLEKKNLTVITKNTESNAMIMADPRRMWRVFDNLLGNICKYSLEGTRVYLTLEEDAEKCRIIFKNTSESELDMSPDELMKRFVRGDVSREGDGGNGLGLSIASNLVTLQKGTMDISIDGDLFKVTLEFGKIRGIEDGNQTETGN